MSTLDVLNAIGEAHAALVRLPELEAEIKRLTEERDFVKLERDEAETTIQRLKARITDLEANVSNLYETITTQQATITELEARNDMLNTALIDMTKVADDTRNIANDRLDRIGRDSERIMTLEHELAHARTVTESLQNVLKGIGKSILSAVEVPEVTSAKPFPVSNPVGLPDQAKPELDASQHLMVDPIMAEPTGENLVKSEPAAGCFPYRYW